MGNTEMDRDGSSTEEEEFIENENHESDNEGDNSKGGEDDSDEDESLSPEELREKLKKSREIAKKSQEIAKNQEIRAKKAEAELKKGVKVEKKEAPAKTSDLSTEDVLTIARNNIHDEDIPDLREYAQMKGISIKEALNSSVMKTLLAEKAEERATAEASHTGTSKRQNGARTSAEILTDAAKGQLPDDPAKLAKARMDQKMATKEHRKR